MLETPLRPAVKPAVPSRYCHSHRSYVSEGSTGGPRGTVSKRDRSLEHVRPLCIPPDLTHLEDGSSAGPLEAERGDPSARCWGLSLFTSYILVNFGQAQSCLG